MSFRLGVLVWGLGKSRKKADDFVVAETLLVVALMVATILANKKQ
jgi:hypothetical protein